MHPTAAVLLDIDGTLVDSNAAHAEAWAEAFHANGRQIPPKVIRESIGKGGDKMLAQVAGIDDESELGKAISKARAEIFMEKFVPRLQAFSGAREFVERLRLEGYSVAIATSAKKDEADALLKIAHIEDLIDARATSDDATHSKPDPDIVNAALKRLHVHASDAFLIGDTPYDVEAGNRAHVKVLAVCSGGWNRQGVNGS